MGWTRRDFLRGVGGLSGAVLLGGCADAVAGSPRAASTAPSSRPRTTTSSRTSRSSRIRVGVRSGEPYGFQDGSKLTGQTVEIARIVLSKLGFGQVDFVLRPLDTLLPSLAAQQVDMAGGLYVDRGRCGSMAYSRPDHVALTALAVPPGNPKGLTTLPDAIAAGATVAVMEGLPEHTYLTKSGAPADKVKALRTPDVMVQEVERGRADCAAFSDIGLRGIVKAGIARLDVTPGFALPDQDVVAAVFAFPKAKAGELVEIVNAELVKLHNSGEWLKISEPFGFTKENVPPADLTTEKLCGG